MLEPAAHQHMAAAFFPFHSAGGSEQVSEERQGSDSCSNLRQIFLVDALLLGGVGGGLFCDPE